MIHEPPLAGRTVVVAISGGVDSAVAAAILRDARCNVVGVTMIHPLLPLNPAVERVAESLQIPLHFVDVGAAFDAIVDAFVRDYYAGLTPNPCVVCNATVKFGLLVEAAWKLGAAACSGHPTLSGDPLFATGHYARTHDGALFTALDTTKDQSYVLHRINRTLLSRIVFPLGTMTKRDVRHIAETKQLPLNGERESQDICFIPSGDRTAFLRSRRPFATSGRFVSVDGQPLAAHDGYEAFTVGQRKGFGVGLGRRLFVTKIDAATNDVVLGDRGDLACSTFTVGNLHWLTSPPREGRAIPCAIKVRYRTSAVSGTVTPSRARTGEDVAVVVLDTPTDGVAPGQSAVFYDGERVLGGGTIQKSD